MIRKTGLAAALVTAATSVAMLLPAPAAYANHGGPSSPVVGYIQIVNNGGGPTYFLFGELATPQWRCTATSPVPYTVTCTPTPLVTNFVWHCHVLHADITGLTPTARGRTSMDCNGDGVYEAQTAIIAGVLADTAWAVSTVNVTAFSCRVDGGALPATPNFRAGCGDPGLVRLH